MPNNQLVTQQNIFSYIPEVAQGNFYYHFENWYLTACENTVVPFVHEELLFSQDEPSGRDHFSNFFYEIFQYRYASKQPDIILGNDVFPLSPNEWPDNHSEDCHEAYIDELCDPNKNTEFEFALDVKSYMDTNHIFYQDKIRWGSNVARLGGYQNVPVVRVW